MRRFMQTQAPASAGLWAMRERIVKRRLDYWVATPSIMSFGIASIFFAVCLRVLHPGYAINDDLKMISIAVGYPGSSPAPFLVFSNVLLGFLLVALHALHTSLNWEMLLFSAINLLSVSALLYVLLEGSMPTSHKIGGIALVLASAAYFALNITFTSVAALACFAGLCLIMTAARSASGLRKRAVLAGMTLILVASLIRLEMLALVFPLFVPAGIFLFHSFNTRTVISATVVTASLVFAGYALDRLYVRAHPDWNAYYFYNKAAQQLQDAHRLENVGRQIRQIGWSGNDQELFARYFFPDAGIYSIDRIRYLIDHVPGTGQDPAASAMVFLKSLANLAALSSLVLIVSIGLWTQASPGTRTATWIVLTTGLICVSENYVLVWAYKDPKYVLFSLLGIAAMLGVVVLNWSYTDTSAVPGSRGSRFARIFTLAFLLTAALATALSLRESMATSRLNGLKVALYHAILTDIQDLQMRGKILQGALIVSPAHGLPWEWADPLVLDLPQFAYFDTGWITFSPAYEQILQAYGIRSLPDALYEQNNIYLMTRSAFTPFLRRYYEEHEGIRVGFRPIYTMPNPYNFDGYDNVLLYKVERLP